MTTDDTPRCLTQAEADLTARAVREFTDRLVGYIELDEHETTTEETR